MAEEEIETVQEVLAEAESQRVMKTPESKSSEELTPYEKAGVLLIALGVATSAAVLKYLPEGEVERLSIVLAKLRDVSSDQVQKVIADFYEMMMARQYVSKGGLEYAKQILEKAWGTRKAEEILKRIEAATEVSAFFLLQTVDDTQLLSFLQDEHPQTAALILANLKPKQAATIISQLSEDLQSEIAFRLATMEKTSPEMVREIENVLREQVGDVFGTDMASTGGAHAVAGTRQKARKEYWRPVLT